MSTSSDGLWLPPDQDPRADAPTGRGEVAVVTSYLRHYRLTFELKCADLTPEQLATRSVPPSTLSLLGLLRHLAKVEHSWSVRVLQGRPETPRLYRTDEQPDLDFEGAVAEDAVVAQAWADWRREAAAAEAWLATDDLDRLVTVHGDAIEVREVVVHLIEEYARHCGHADLLRECLDGRTGQ